MGAGASSSQRSEEEVAMVRKRLLKELQDESKRPEDMSDVTDFREEVQRLRGWVREVNHVIISELGETHEMMMGTGSMKSLYGNRPRTAGISSVRHDKPHETVKHLDNGIILIERDDGSRKQIEPDGLTIETFPDGRKLQTHPSGRTQETYADGTRITRTEDGKMVVKRPDGSKLQKNPDGSTIEALKDGTITQYNPTTRVRIVVDPDGTQTQTNDNDGSMIQVFPDGTKIDTDRSGCRIVKYPDGRKVQRNPNGTVIETWPNGHKIQTKVDGSRIEVFPDGKKVQTMVDGTVVEQLKDGTQIRGVIGTFVCVQCWRCRTIMSVQRSAFVVSCRVCRNVIVASKAQVIGQPDGSAPSGGNAPSKTAKDIEDDVRAIFERFDTSNTQSITKNELAVMLAELQLPSDHFDVSFAQYSKEKPGELNWEEFHAFFDEVQKYLTDTSAGSALAMTKELLEEQRRAISAERREREAKLRELQAQAATGNKEAASEAESSEAMLQRLKEEYEIKSAQLKEATDAKRRRQKEFLEKRKQERRLKSPK